MLVPTRMLRTMAATFSGIRKNRYARRTTGARRSGACFAAACMLLMCPTAGRTQPPVGVVAAGDSLWFLNPARPESLHMRPAMPLPEDVYDLAVQVNVRPPLFFEDTRLVGGTNKGIFVWTPISEELYRFDMGPVVALDASLEVWAALRRTGDETHLLFAQTNRTDDLLNPEIWKESGDAVGTGVLHLLDLPGSWFAEEATEPNWETLGRMKTFPAATVLSASLDEALVATPPPFEHRRAIDINNPEVRTGKLWGIAAPRSLGLFESYPSGRATLRYVGAGFTNDPIWESSGMEPVTHLGVRNFVGGSSYWIAASEDSVLLLEVPAPRRAAKGDLAVEVVAPRASAGAVTAAADDATRWAAMAFAEPGGTTVVEMFDLRERTTAPAASCRVRGGVQALAVVPLESLR